MPTKDSTRMPVVFVHGLWLHSESWANWIEFFRKNGYHASTADWPGESDSAEATRRNPKAVAGHGVTEIAEHVAAQLKGLPGKPILVGHSLGGWVVQKLLGQDLAAAAIAIDPAPIQGVWQIPFSALKATLPTIGNPLNYSGAVSLTETQFRYGFTNLLPQPEAHELYIKYAIPTPARPVFQAAAASLNPWAATRVNVANATRGPLLITSASEDHTVPPVLSRSALRVYRNSPAVTELKEFTGRGHSLTIDSGWRLVAEYCLTWLKGKGL